MRYVLARFEAYQRDKAYRISCAKALRILTENTAGIMGGTVLRFHYEDMYKHPERDDEPKQEQTADAVIDHVRQSIGRLKV